MLNRMRDLALPAGPERFGALSEHDYQAVLEALPPARRAHGCPDYRSFVSRSDASP
jgi:hypothetical protein